MWVGAALLALVAIPLFSGLLAKEAEGWLALIPESLLRVARRRVSIELRDELYDEWRAELHAALHTAEERPLSRLALGIRFAAGLLWAARRIATALESARAHEHAVTPATATIQHNEDLARLAVFEDRDRIACQLHDLVIQRLFSVGLRLQSIERQIPEPGGVPISTVISDLDQVIDEVRRTVFDLQPRD
jgi:signal transduction histidine kinase